MQLFLRRIGAFFIDINICAVILLPVAILGTFVQFDFLSRLGAISGMLLLMFKDLYHPDGSFGKKMLGLVITIDRDEESEDIRYYKVIRNITLLLWPVEVLVVILNKGRRLGDIMAKSSVEICAPPKFRLP